MKVDAFTYALMNNMDPVTGNPLPTGITPKELASIMYAPQPAQSMPGSGGPSSYMSGYYPDMNYQTVRSVNQPISDSLLNGLLSNVAVGTIGKLGEGLGMIANIPRAISTKDLNALFDNDISNTYRRGEQYFKDKFPVYQGREYQGNFLSKMMTDDFWFNDGFDALAFLLSAYVPGAVAGELAAVSKVGSLINLGTKAKGLKLANLLKNVGEKELESGLAQGVSTAYNTITEAGFEAKDAFDRTFEAYKKTMPEEEAKVKASRAAARVFSANMAGLLIPNAIQSSFMHGNNAFNLRKIKDLVYSNKELDTILKDRASYLANIAEGITSEGLWEENFQNSVQRYEDRMTEGWGGNKAGDYAYGMLLGLSGTLKQFIPGMRPEAGTAEDEAVTSIALGGLIGGGMGAVSTLAERRNLAKTVGGIKGKWEQLKLANEAGKKFLVDNYLVGLKDYGVVDEVDAEGNPTGNRKLNYIDPVSGEVTVDPQKVRNALLRRTRDMDLTLAQVDATLANDKYLMDLNREMALMSYAWHLKSVPNLSKEDIEDLIKYDVKVPIEKELEGVVSDSLLTDNLSKINNYLKVYDDTTEATGSIYDFHDDNVSRDFTAMIRRGYYYDAAKKQALKHIKEGASEQVKPQIDSMINSIDTHLSNFAKSIPTLKAHYDAEIAPSIQMGKRLDEIDSLLKSKETPDDQKIQLEAEQRRIKYVLNEATLVDNYYAEDFGGNRATEYSSASLSKNEPAAHARKRGNQHTPLSMKEKYYYNKALSQLFNTELSKDLAGETDPEVAAEKVISRPELNTTKANRDQLRESLLQKKKDLEDNSNVDLLEAVRADMNANINIDSKAGRSNLVQDEYEQEDYDNYIQGAYPAIEAAAKVLYGDAHPFTLDNLSKNPNMLIDLYKDIDKQIKGDSTKIARVDGYIKALDGVFSTSDALQVENNKLDKLTPEKRNEEFKYRHFLNQTADIRGLIDQFNQDKENFVGQVNPKIAILENLKQLFQDRTDISDELKNRILDLINNWLDILAEAKTIAVSNLAKRYEIQKLSEVTYTEGLKDIFTEPSLVEAIRNIIPNIDSLLTDVASYSEKVHSMEGYEAILELIRKTATAEQKKAIFDKVVELANKLGSEVQDKIISAGTEISGNRMLIVQGALVTVGNSLSLILSNPRTALDQFLRDPRLFGARVTAPYQEGVDPNPFQRYNLDRDFSKLIFNLENTNYAGLSTTEQNLLKTLYDVFAKSRAYHAILNITQSNIDSVELYKFESKELGQVNPRIPTAQQAVSVREAARQLNNPRVTNGQAAVFGIFGSGKTAMVAKKIINFLVPENQRKNKVLAFAQSQETSETIANSVGGTQTSYNDFINMTPEQIKSYEYLVVDEAFTLHSNQIDVLDSAAKELGIKILYLGDPSQNKSEDTLILDNQITQAQPLTVVLRTNNPAITYFASNFQYNPLAVSSAVAEATSSITDRTEADSGVFITSNDKSPEEQIVQAAKNNNGKSKLIISNHNLEYYRQQLQGTNVKVLSPYNSQGQEADEVFLDLSRSGEAVNGGPIQGELAFNTMMATAASRAKESLVVANRPGLNLVQAIVPNLAESILNLQGEFDKYAQDYKASLYAYKHFYTKFIGIQLEAPKQAKEDNDTPPPGKPEPNESGTKNADPTVKQPPQEGDIIIEHPSNDNADEAIPGEGLIVRAVYGNEPVSKEKWAIMAQTETGYKMVGVLSADEIKNGNFPASSLRRATSTRDVLRLDVNKTLAYPKEQLDPYVISSVQIQDVRPLTFIFGETYVPATSNSVKILMNNFYNELGVTINGDINTQLKIYINPAKQQPNTSFRPKAGVPYLVLTGFTLPENKVNFPNLLHVPVRAPKLNVNHKAVQALTKLKTSFDALAGILGKDPIEFFNSEEFEHMLEKFANLHTIDILKEGNTIVRVADFDQKIGEFQQTFKVSDEALSPLFDVLSSIYAPNKVDTRFTKEEFEQWKKDNPDKADTAILKMPSTPRKDKKEHTYGRVAYIEKGTSGKEYARIVQHTVLSQNAGPAALAWAELASSNKNIGGYYPRTIRYVANNQGQPKTETVAKTLLGAKDSYRRVFQLMKDNFYREYQKQVTSLISDIKLSNPNDERLEWLEALEDDLDMYAKQKYHDDEFERNMDRLNMLTGSEEYAESGPMLPSFVIYSDKTDQNGNPIKLTPREFLKEAITQHVPYEALDAIGNTSNYTPSGAYKDQQALFSNLEIHRDGSISYDMGTPIDQSNFDRLGFTMNVSRILPTQVTINLKNNKVQEPVTPTATEESDIEPIIKKYARLYGYAEDGVKQLLIRKFGTVNTIEGKQYLEKLIKLRELSESLNNEEPDDYNRKTTVFEDSTPGSLQTIEWAKKTLQAILPGLDVENQVQFLDNLQMSIFEQPNEDILGRVMNAIVSLKIDENRRVHNQVVYHEAFHMAYRYLFSEKLKTRLKNAFKAIYGEEFTDKEVIEGLAELYQRFDERLNKKTWLVKLFDNIRAFFDTMFRNRLYIEKVFFNLDEGKYSGQVTAKTKEGAPDNMQYIKTNFGTRNNYLHAVRLIKERILDFMRDGTATHKDPNISLKYNLPMNRKEIFDSIYDEFVDDKLTFESEKEAIRNNILTKFNVKSLKDLNEKIQGEQRLLDQGDLELDEQEFILNSILEKQTALKELEKISNVVTLYNTITDVNKKTGNYVFFEIIENLYPSYKVEEDYHFELDNLTEDDVSNLSDEDKAALGVEEDASMQSVMEAFEGLRAETIDHAKINWATKQSLALKDFFTFIPLLKYNSKEVEKKNGLVVTINPKIAYIKALKLINKLDLNSDSINEEIAYLQKHEDLDRWDMSILSKLQDLYNKIADLEEAKHPYTIVTKSYSLKSNADTYFFVDFNNNTDVHSLTYEDAKKLATEDPNRYKLITTSSNSLIELYDKANELTGISQADFSDIYYQREALNYIANIQSFMGSLKDTDYIMSVKSTRGRNRSLSMLIARGNSHDVNTKAVVKESFKSNLNGTKPLHQNHARVRQIVDGLKADNAAQNKTAFINLMGELGIKDIGEINDQTLNRNRISIAETLSTLTSVSQLPTRDVLLDDDSIDVEYDMDSWLVQNNSGINAIAKVIASDRPKVSASSIISVLKQKIYKHTLTNPIYKVGNKLINYQERIIRGIDETSSLAKLPEFLSIFKNINPFLMTKNNKFLLRLHSLFELDGHVDRWGNGNNERASEVLAFDKKRFHTTLFSSGFLSSLPSKTYKQLFYQQADKPRPIGAIVDTIGDKQLETLLPIVLDNMDYFTDPERAAFMKMHSKSFTNELVNGKLFTEAKNDPEGFIKGFKKLVAKEAITLADELALTRTDTVGDKSQVEALLSLFNEAELLSVLNNALVEANRKPITAIEPLANKSVENKIYRNTSEMFLPFAYAFLMNHYVNSYFINQLVANSSQFYGSGKTVLKRMTGAAGPGHYAYIKPRFGTKKQFRAVVIKDVATSADAIFEQVKNALGKEHSEEELTALRNFFGVSGIERTDGQVFITPSRLHDLQKGYGREFRLGNILKPKFFGPRIETNPVTGERVSIPTYIKPSAVVLADDLLYEPGTKNPRKGFEELARIREHMDAHQIDELVFGSAMKVGKPSELATLSEFLSGPPMKGILVLDNEHYQIQLNPRAKVDSTAALFTQLTYFLNIYSSSEDLNNVERAEKVYSAIAFLFEKGGKLFDRATSSPEKFKSLLMGAFSEKGDELVFADLIESGIAPNSPIFEQKAFIKLASMLEKFSTKIRLPGGKLVLQSDVTFKNPQTGEDLKFVNDNGKLVAEVIVPRGIFPPDIVKQIEAGKNVFENPMLLGFRIPSTELHSAVAMKVVGFYDNSENTNMVIAPELLVALHGSDFDVDSLFFVKRAIAKKDIRISNKNDINDIITLALELEELLENTEFKAHSAYGAIYNTLQKIRKGLVAEGKDITPQEYENLANPRVKISIENDFQQFVKDYHINISTEQNELAARKNYAKLAGLAWLDRQKNDLPPSKLELGYSNNEAIIRNSRLWSIRSADAFSLFDIRRQIYNLSKDQSALSVFPSIVDTVDRIVKAIQKEQIIPGETVIKEGEFIGFKKNDDGVYVFDNEYDDYLSKRLSELKKLEQEAEFSGFKKLKKIINRQYRELLGLKEEYYKGSIVETFLETISDPNNETRMTRPISKSYLVGRDTNNEYHESSAIYEVAQIPGLISKEDVDLSNYNDVYKAFKSVADMQRLTGIFASSIKVLAYIGRSGVSQKLQNQIIELDNLVQAAFNKRSKGQALSEKDVKELQNLKDSIKKDLRQERKEMYKDKSKEFLPNIANSLSFHYKVNDDIYYINTMNEFILGTNDTVSIYDVLDALVNIAIDNIKDQELFALQATTETGTLYAALISLGLPARDIIAMLYNPTMQDMLNIIRNDSSVKLDEFVHGYKKIVQARIVNELGESVPEEIKRNENQAIGFKDLRLMLTADSFKDLKINLASGSKRKIDNIDNLDKLSNKELVQLYSFLHIIETGIKLGNNIRDLSSFLSILRGMPITFESIQDIEKALEALGRIIENEEDASGLDNVDVLSRDEVLEILSNLGTAFYTKKEEAAYKIGAFFSRNPHILAAYRRLMQLKKTIQDNFPLHSEVVVDFMKDLFGKDTKISDNHEQAMLRSELRRYLITQVVDRDFYDNHYVRTYASRKTGKLGSRPLYGVDAWSQQLVDTVRKLKDIDQELATKEKRAPNAFLEALYIDNNKLRFDFDVELDRALVEELRQGFRQLQYFSFEDGYLNYSPKSSKSITLELGKSKALLDDYDTNYNATELQKDILYHLALVDGLRFSNNNYSIAIPPSMIKVLMTKVSDIENRFKEDEDFRNKLAYHIKVELLRENANAVSTYINTDDITEHAVTSEQAKDIEEKDEAGRDIIKPLNGVFINAKDNKIYYDRSFTNPYKSEAERLTNKEDINKRFPPFITIGYDNDTQVLYRVTEVTENELAYISLGKASGTYTRIPNIDEIGNIEANFRPNMPTQYIADTSINKFSNMKDYSYIKEGEPVRLVGYADKSRLNPRLVVITKQTPKFKKVGEKEVPNGFEYEVEDYEFIPPGINSFSSEDINNLNNAYEKFTKTLPNMPIKAKTIEVLLHHDDMYRTGAYMTAQEFITSWIDETHRHSYVATKDEIALLNLAAQQLAFLKAQGKDPLILAGTFPSSRTAAATYYASLNMITVDIKSNKNRLEALRNILHELAHFNTGIIVMDAYINVENSVNIKSTYNIENSVKDFKTVHNQSISSFSEELRKLNSWGLKAYKHMSRTNTHIDGTALSIQEQGTLARSLYVSSTVDGEKIPYGFSNHLEMLAEFMSSDRFRELTKLIQIPIRIEDEYSESNSKRSLFSGILTSITSFLRKVTLYYTNPFKVGNRSDISSEEVKSVEYVTLYDILEELIHQGYFDNLALDTKISANKKVAMKQAEVIAKDFTQLTPEHVLSIVKEIYGIDFVDGEEYSAGEPVHSIALNVVSYDHNLYNTDAKIEELKRNSEKYRVNPNNNHKYEQVNNPARQLNRVTDDEQGWTADFKRRPKTIETIAERAADMWGGESVDKAKFTRHGWVKQSEWIAKEEEILSRGRHRGTIVHTVMEQATNGDPDGKLLNRLNELLGITNYEPEDFEWVKTNLKTIYRNADINILDNIDEDKKDKIVGEVVLANEILDLVGRSDIFVFHADGTISVKDIKAGYSFFNSLDNETMLFGDQPAANDLIWDSWKNHAHLQVMTYALLYKLQHPEAKFKSLDVLWMPDLDAVNSDRFRNKTNPEIYLKMIYQMLEAKYPEKLQALKESMSEADWKKVWDPKEYMAGYSKEIRDSRDINLENVPIDQQIRAKIQKIKTIILADLDPHTYRKAAFSGKNAYKRTELVKKLMKELLDLQKTANDLDISTTTEDISGFQNWLFTSSTTSNPYIQTWDQLYMERRQMFNDEVEASRNKFLSLLKPIKDIYLKMHPGKAMLDNVTRGGVNLINARDLFAFAYKPIRDEGGNIIDWGLRNTEEDYNELLTDNTNFPYINQSNIHYYKNLLEFVNNSYARFFVDKEGKTALANRVATYSKIKGFDKPITTLELYNGKRVKLDKKNTNRDKELFEYKRGFMPKVPPLLSEFGKSTGTGNSSRWWQLWYQRNLTFTEEHVFEGFDKKAMAEGLPMKYLNNKKDFASNPDLFTLNLEHQFDRFMRAYLWKEHMDDVFAYGQGLRIYFNAREDAPQRLVDFMQRELDLKLRGRPAGFGKNENFISKNKYNISLIKVLSKLKFIMNYPLLALNYLGGSANAIFTMLLTTKHAIQNSIGRRSGLNGLNGDEWDFGIKHLIKAWPEVLKVVTSGMAGNIRDSKVYLLAKKFGYLPSSFDWSTAPHNLMTAGNRIFDSKLLFLFYSLPEETIALLTMTAQLMSMTLQNGPLAGTSIYDMYELVDKVDENGNKYRDIQWKVDPTTGKPYVRGLVNMSAESANPEYRELTELDTLEIRRLYNAYDKMHGGYRHQDKISLDYTIWGQLLLQFKRYLPHILRQGATSAAKRSNMGNYVVTSMEDGTPTVEWVSKVMEGRWRVVGNVLLRGIAVAAKVDNIPTDAEGLKGWIRRNLGGLENYDMSKLDAGQREALRDAWITLAIMFLGLAFIAGGSGDGDDDDPIYRYTNRIFNDLTQMYNISELGKNLVNWSPVSLKKLHDFQRDSFTVMFSLAYWGFGEEEKAFTPSGRLEGINKLMKDLPITSIIRKTEDLATADIFNQ